MPEASDPPTASQGQGRTEMNDVEKLVDSFQLEQLDRDLFLAEPGRGEGRLFGGQVAAQSVVAAGRTVAQGTLHSLHAYFLRPGSYDKPLRFIVDRIRDGRTFTTRRVVAMQGGEAIFNLSASFACPEEGLAHQEAMPEAPDPAGLPELSQVRARWFDETPPDDDDAISGPMEIRLPDPADAAAKSEPSHTRIVWMRLTSPPPEDPLMRVAILVHASDRTLMGTALQAGGLTPGRGIQGTSLDHVLWLHEVPALEDWFLYASESPMARSARALIHGAMYEKSSGRRIASVAQEGLLRRARKS